MEFGIRALGHALCWVENHENVRSGSARRVAARRVTASRVSVSGAWPEAAARSLLADSGVPVVPAELVRSADEAVEAAPRAGRPAALKICSAHITPKSHVGGVPLGLGPRPAVR